MRRPAVVAVALALVAAGSALAAKGDPQKRITPADQARAKAMLVRASDLPGFTVGPPQRDSGDLYCAALDASDLTLTGQAASRQFILQIVSTGSSSEVYESLRDADAAWRRSTSAAGVRCAKTVLGREFAKQGARLQSLRKVAFPRVATRTVAYRVTFAVAAAQGDVPLTVDLVALMHSRAHSSIVVASVLAPPDRALELRLARTVSKRMTTAMRGA
jgi:hypothetical protein